MSGNTLLSKSVAVNGAASTTAGSMAAMHLPILGELLIAAPLGGVVGMGIWYFWPGRRPLTKSDVEKMLQESEALRDASGISNRQLVETIKLVSDKLDRILLEASSIKSPNTRRRISHLVSLGRKIIEDFRQDPSDIRLAQSWIHSYLDQTIDCTKQYSQLSRTGARSIEAQKQMADFDDLLDLLHDKTQELLDHQLSNDTLSMQVNVGVLRDQIKTEGMK